MFGSSRRFDELRTSTSTANIRQGVVLTPGFSPACWTDETKSHEAVCVIERSSDTRARALLLDRRGDQVTISDEVVEAAAGNAGSGKEVMALLFDRQGYQVTITNKVIEAAAGNKYSGEEVMALHLDLGLD